MLGFTKAVAELGFQEGLNIELEKTRSHQENYAENYTLETLSNHYSEKYNVLLSLDFETWLKNLPEVMKLKRKGVSYLDDNYDDYSPLVKFMLFEHFFGAPMGNYNEWRHLLRLIVEAFDANDNLVYELTNVVAGGWITVKDLFDNDEYISPIHNVSQRTIVITEGSTDTMIIERSLRLLYPHLANYFRFLDFKGTNIAGGASALAHTVKAFAGVGIVNRIIALFDNDTGAEDALRALNNIILPRNIIVLRYPEIESAKNYPTFGPTGIVKMNVNGLAGSIELYLGDDVLRKEDGSQIPVQWKGYVQSLHKYQGEITFKSDVQSKFMEKIKVCESDASLIDNFDWTGIRAIMNEMFTAFNTKDEEEILKIISEPFETD